MSKSTLSSMNVPTRNTLNIGFVIFIISTIDLIILNISGFAFVNLFDFDTVFLPVYYIYVSLCSVFYTIFCVYFRVNTFEKIFNIQDNIPSACISWVAAIVLFVCSAFFLQFNAVLTPNWVLSWLIVGMIAIVVTRMMVTTFVNMLHKLGYIEKKIIIVGGGEDAHSLIQALESSAKGVRICGVFDDRSNERSQSIPGYPRLGTIDQLVSFARKTKIDLLIVSIPLYAENRLLMMLKKLWVLPVNIRISSLSTQLRFHERSYSYLGTVPLLDIFDRPLKDSDIISKWIIDKVLGALILVLVSPIMIIAAICVKLDSKGPIIFKQNRYGFNNELIQVYKFRSMYQDQSDANAVKLATRGDTRITRVGRFIRKTSIDELPQLFNVLFHGNLSLVGPRPHAMQAKAANQLYEEVVDGYFARHKVKPGITGYAQIHGWRGETDTLDKIQKRVEYDLYYIEKWSIFLDLYIIFITPISLLMRNENAY